MTVSVIELAEVPSLTRWHHPELHLLEGRVSFVKTGELKQSQTILPQWTPEQNQFKVRHLRSL